MEKVVHEENRSEGIKTLLGRKLWGNRKWKEYSPLNKAASILVASKKTINNPSSVKPEGQILQTLLGNLYFKAFSLKIRWHLNWSHKPYCVVFLDATRKVQKPQGLTLKGTKSDQWAKTVRLRK